MSHEEDSCECKNSFNVVHAVAICIIWFLSSGAIGLLAYFYKGDQNVSLENAIAYIIIGSVIVTSAILFRDAIAAKIRNWD